MRLTLQHLTVSQHLSVDGDQGGGPTYASIVLPEGQRSVATAQVEDGSSDAVTYSSVRASPRCGEKAGDVDVHYATANKPSGKVRSEDNKERLHVTKECSLEVKKLRKEDEGLYICREYLSSGVQVDHTRHEVKLITSTQRPTPTTVKASTTCTSTSKPTTTPVKGAASSSPAARPSTSTPTTHTLNAPTAGVLLRVLVLLGFSVLTLVVLLRLIGWWRTRGNRAATDECIGLNSASDAPPARERLDPGASDQDVPDRVTCPHVSTVIAEGDTEQGYGQFHCTTPHTFTPLQKGNHRSSNHRLSDRPLISRASGPSGPEETTQMINRALQNVVLDGLLVQGGTDEEPRTMWETKQCLNQCLSNRVFESHNSVENQDLFQVSVKQQRD
ncbi:unnamed protein product [Arctogadus glacialis]